MGCFATEENTEDDNPPIGINYSRRRFKMKSVTRYFRNAVAASMQGTVNYKKERFFVVTEGELLSGKLSEENNFNIWKMEYDAESDNDEEKLKIKNVIIALKTLATEFRDGGKMEDNIEEMTSFFFLPLCVTRTGKLCMPVEGKIPWIPREYLRPMEDPLLAVGDGEKYDEFLEHTTNERYQLDSWQDYLAYAIKLYEFVAEILFKSNYIRNGNELFKADGRYYLFQDSTVNASFYILQLYNALIKGTVNSLYDKITNGKIEPSKPLIKNTDISKMKAHVGQMGGAYPLSPSQREAMNHFGEIKEGNLLAVSGPPGTGKTTFLQSVVADMYVKSALKRERAPIIVAASTNNQAVTNIIDSFGQISEIGISNLEHKWITGTDSFAVYFPSNGKVKEAAQKRYQYTTVRGGGFVDELESKENRRSSGRLFKQEFHQYFRRETASIDFALCEEILWKELEKVNKDRINCISMLDNIKSVLGRESYGAYVERIMQNIRKEEAIRNDLQNQIEKIQETTQWFLNRMQEWRKAYQQFPWYVRLLKKFFCFKSKIQRWSFSFVNQAELSFLRRDMSIDEIEKVYMQKICDNDLQKSQLQEQKLCIDDKIEKLKSQKKEIDIKMEHLKEGYQNFEKYNVAVPEDSVLNEFDLCKLNDVLDRVRYAEFWLAVHYYESRWLKEDNPVSEKQKGKTFKNILDDMYHRIAMISPCMVMTFFMLPKQFWAYDGNDKKNYFMCNYIDLLVVDEAGQTSPEIAAASFSLAKKAVIVGDEEQIPPVWGTARALDIAMAISNGVIANKGEYGMLEENGLNCSQSSIMKMAALSCEFNKYKRGLFLSEHRRCYNEIITYCNKLVYEGKLEPKRGSFYAAEYNELRGLLPVMGFRQVTTAKSEKYGGSRRNREEAEAIIMWLQKKYEKILLCYSDKDGIEERGVLGIITPFKSQSFLIKNLIKRRLPEYSKFIDVGTVHTFQGAERKVILFSSVYGSEDGCYFINRAPDLMNVAVSRAKDSFLVFGDKECLTGGEKTAAGLLKKMVFVEGEELC